MTDVLIREATDDDGPGLAELIAGVFAEYEGCLYEASEFPEHARPASWFAERGGRLWIVTEDDVLVGSFGIVPGPRTGEFRISKVYLAASQRGRGLAAALLAGAEAFALASGGRRLSLWTDTRFVEGHRFYERNGFLRLPGVRALHDVSNTLEMHYAKDLDQAA